ncbi:hypothetical protein SM124_22840 [Bacillus sp. 31A1R]|uniref:Uncharacterized protein n=1 Tax=Robertmurraya mangrovi TaxID=3098077 RepID=A0ABU5J5A1_9BACI|nr:hypothetical protein [Bacillus sp. 31A1R]MDZ5474517.1 hypothetical protein [Bacillus sp. 31A1R]
MPKKTLIELVESLKKSGIQVSFTKPRSESLLLLPPCKTLTSTTNC